MSQFNQLQINEKFFSNSLTDEVTWSNIAKLFLMGVH